MSNFETTEHSIALISMFNFILKEVYMTPVLLFFWLFMYMLCKNCDLWITLEYWLSQVIEIRGGLDNQTNTNLIERGN